MSRFYVPLTRAPQSGSEGAPCTGSPGRGADSPPRAAGSHPHPLHLHWPCPGFQFPARHALLMSWRGDAAHCWHFPFLAWFVHLNSAPPFTKCRCEASSLCAHTFQGGVSHHPLDCCRGERKWHPQRARPCLAWPQPSLPTLPGLRFHHGCSSGPRFARLWTQTSGLRAPAGMTPGAGLVGNWVNSGTATSSPGVLGSQPSCHTS